MFIAIGGMLGITMKCVSAYASFAGAMAGLKGESGVLGKTLTTLTTKFKAVQAASKAEQAVIKTNTALYGANAAGIYKTTAATRFQRATSAITGPGTWEMPFTVM